MANLSAPPCALNSGHTGKRTTWYSCLLHDTLCSQINCVDVINSIFKSTAIQWITQFILHLESVLHKIQNQIWAQFLCPNSQQLGSTFYSPNGLMTNFTPTVCMLSDLKCLSGYRWHIDLRKHHCCHEVVIYSICSAHKVYTFMLDTSIW